MSTNSPATRLRRAISAFLPALVIAFPAYASAQATGALPDGKAILADYVKAVGGREAFDKLQSIHSTGTFTLPALGMGGSLETFSARPANTFMHITIEGVGEIKRGVNGTVAWSLDPFQGARVLTGAEQTAALEDAMFASNVRGADAFTSVETIEKASVDSKDCFKVKLVTKDGRASTNCYAADTKFLVQSSRIAPGPEGDTEVVTTLRAYKQFNGVMMPTELVINAGGQEQVVTITNITANDVAATTFDLPAEVKLLVK